VSAQRDSAHRDAEEVVQRRDLRVIRDLGGAAQEDVGLEEESWSSGRVSADVEVRSGWRLALCRCAADRLAVLVFVELIEEGVFAVGWRDFVRCSPRL
jgi:hypothetical protein